MNWLEMFAIFVVTGLFGAMVVDVVKDSDAFPWSALAFGALIFVVVVLAWAYGL